LEKKVPHEKSQESCLMLMNSMEDMERNQEYSPGIFKVGEIHENTG
jgi:hypothetical protein